MSEWAPKRFWTGPTPEAGGGFGVRLDGRPVKTPAKAALMLPTRAMAGRWPGNGRRRANRSTRRPCRPPAPPIPPSTRSRRSTRRWPRCWRTTARPTCSATAPSPAAGRAAGRGLGPAARLGRADLGAPLVPRRGHARAADPPRRCPPCAGGARAHAFRLTGLHDLVTLSGSLVIGLAAARGRPGRAICRCRASTRTGSRSSGAATKRPAAGPRAGRRFCRRRDSFSVQLNSYGARIRPKKGKLAPRVPFT